MDRFKLPFYARWVCRVLAAVLASGCIFALAIAATDLHREFRERGDADYARATRIAFDFVLVFFALLGLAATKEIWTWLGLLFRAACDFYRSGKWGFEGTIAGIPPGNTLGRLLLARQDVRLESHGVWRSPRLWVMHCPMCQGILTGFSTDQARCPHCSQGIIYLQLAMDFDADVPEAMVVGQPALGWVPRRVGEYLKKRYGEIWR